MSFINSYYGLPTPCQGCKDRFVGCHSICKKYADYRKQVTEISNAKKKQMINNKPINKSTWKKRQRTKKRLTDEMKRRDI